MQNENTKLKVAFLGTPDFAIPAFKKLIRNGYEIVAVLTGQGPIRALTKEHEIKIIELKDLTDLAFDIGIVVAYGKIIPEKYLQIPKYGFINIHPSLLPKYRGPSPIQAAIMNGDEETGVSIMVVDKEMDHGQIVASRKYKVDREKYYKEIEAELAEFGADLLIETLPKFITSEIRPQKQDHEQATYTKMLKRADGKINWNQSTKKIYDQIRALNPEPGTWTTWQGKVLNIKSAALCTTYEVVQVGAVARINGKICVATGDGQLELKTVQLGGKKEMNIEDLLNGHRDLLNSKLDS